MESQVKVSVGAFGHDVAATLAWGVCQGVANGRPSGWDLLIFIATEFKEVSVFKQDAETWLSGRGDLCRATGSDFASGFRQFVQGVPTFSCPCGLSVSIGNRWVEKHINDVVGFQSLDFQERFGAVFVEFVVGVFERPAHPVVEGGEVVVVTSALAVERTVVLQHSDKADFGARQTAYNRRIRGRAVKLTPQTVIDGVISVAGSQREAVEKRIVEAQFLDEMARPTPPLVTIGASGEGMLRTRIDNVGTRYDAYVVSFRRRAVTKVSAGDNAGLVFREANVVRAVAPIASDRSGPGDFTFAAPEKGLQCAVLVQERDQGRIVAARYCSDDDGA